MIIHIGMWIAAIVNVSGCVTDQMCGESDSSTGHDAGMAGPQPTTMSGAEDATTLVNAHEAADKTRCNFWISYPGSVAHDGCALDSWTAETDPCSGQGWIGVECGPRPTASDGNRVVEVRLPGNTAHTEADTGIDAETSLGGELFPYFGRLGALEILYVPDNWALIGNVADLTGLTELRYLHLSGCPWVVGDIATLAALTNLGGAEGHGNYNDNGLYLTGTAVHGSVAPLRALPGLGPDWGNFWVDFQPCSSFGSDGHPSDNPSADQNDWAWGTGFGCADVGLAPVPVRHST